MRAGYEDTTKRKWVVRCQTPSLGASILDEEAINACWL